MEDADKRAPAEVEIKGRLQARWLGFWQRVGAKGNSEPFFKDLVGRYSEDHRAYHTLRHIEHCLTELDEVRDLAVDPDAVEMAIWYHDVIYDRATGNEEKSADFAVRVASEMSLAKDFAAEVSRLILTTKHLSVPEDNDARLLADIDIAILGQSPERFDEYEDEVRREYSFVDNAAFSKGRSSVMRLFADRENVYSTDFFRIKYEAAARGNLDRSLRRWS